MKVGICDPYLNTLGGGEKYVLNIAECLSQDHDVFIFWDDKEIFEEAKKRFSIDLSKVKLTSNIFLESKFSITKYLQLQEFDSIIYVSDGSIPLVFSRNNILLFQFPVNWVNANFWFKLKLKRFNTIICYSEFVKSFVDKKFSIKSVVLPPYIDLIDAKSAKKENIILSVGRFTQAMNTKKQEILMDVFKNMCDKGLKNWSFILVGATLNEDKGFVDRLKAKINDYPIKIFTNVSLEDLKEYYKKAKIYWHAAGFGENLEIHPEKAEHFGITTIEAMSAGVVPVVFNAGGQKEIIKDNKNGFLWDTIHNLEEKTENLIKNRNEIEKLSKQAEEDAKMFDKDKFFQKLHKIFKNKV